VPGPLFTVAAYLGPSALPSAPASGALIALMAIFLPGLLLAVAGSSLWTALAQRTRLRAGITGINAAVVGILAAALYNPVWTSAVRDPADIAVAAGALLLLASQRVPPLVVVLLCVAASIVRSLR
jgi:chromate transporter